MKNTFIYLSVFLMFIPILLQSKFTGNYIYLSGSPIKELIAKGLILNPSRLLTEMNLEYFVEMSAQREIFNVILALPVANKHAYLLF